MTVYLDYASSAPITSAALEAYVLEAKQFGNATSLHEAGRRSRRVLEESRELLAAALGARPSEVLFTSGGTEANNLAIKGIFWGRRTADPDRSRIVLSAIEHHSVLDSAFWLAAHAGAELVLLPVDSDGVVDLEALETELRANAARVAVVSVMTANNEIGTLEPVTETARLAARYAVPYHADAVQAVGQIPVRFEPAGLSAMTISGHKLGGPLGVGALLARRDLPIEAIQHGGEQERKLRAGTLNVPGIKAFAVALTEAVAAQQERAAALTDMRNLLIEGVRRVVPEAVLRGPEPGTVPGEDLRLPNNTLFTFPNCEGDSLLYLLDAAGVSASTGSACQAGIPQASHVLLSLGMPEAEARGALRFSLSPETTQDDVDTLLRVLPEAVARAAKAGLASGLGFGGGNG